MQQLMIGSLSWPLGIVKAELPTIHFWDAPGHFIFPY
jgi:hypothetical protein